MLRWCLLSALLFALSASTDARTQKTMWYVSWNIADNKHMNGGIKENVIMELLRLHRSPQIFYDMYTVALQENCFNCNKQNLQKIAKLFLDVLHRVSRHRYEVVGHSATRLSSTCETVACPAGQHGTSLVFVLARVGAATAVSSFHTNKCNQGVIKNAEKGIAMLKLKVREEGGPTVCVSSLHLDHESPKQRQECFRLFMQENRQEVQSCNTIFFAGDYNARTGDSGGDKASRFLTAQQVNALRPKDEMSGSHPYGGERLIDYISRVTGKRFSEGAVNFYPTYSIRPSSECSGRSPCYRGNRPPSWTDRIIHAGSSGSGEYLSLSTEESDHLPVAATFNV